MTDSYETPTAPPTGRTDVADTDYLFRLGKNVREARELLGLTQEIVARRTRGVLTRSSVANIEGGKQSPSLDALVAVAFALRTSVARLLPPDPQVTCPAGDACPFDPQVDR